MLLKICGMREPNNILAVAATIAPQYMGFIFYAPSPRNVTDLLPSVISQLPATIKPTGVFVNATFKVIDETVSRYQLKAIQLHGAESPEFCSKCQEELSVEVLKAFSVATTDDLATITDYQDTIDFALLDTKGQNIGGNGVAFDWSILQNYRSSIPFFLSGGIAPDNLAAVRQLSHPQLVGIDVNSKFEISPALKDIEKLKTLLR
jgi:phosphoribosylanthranilate isomerase